MGRPRKYSRRSSESSLGLLIQAARQGCLLGAPGGLAGTSSFWCGGVQGSFSDSASLSLGTRCILGSSATGKKHDRRPWKVISRLLTSHSEFESAARVLPLDDVDSHCCCTLLIQRNVHSGVRVALWHLLCIKTNARTLHARARLSSDAFERLANNVLCAFRV